MATGMVLRAAKPEQLDWRGDEILDRFPPELKDLEESEEQIKPGLRRLDKASIRALADSADKGAPPPAEAECRSSIWHRGLARRNLGVSVG